MGCVVSDMREEPITDSIMTEPVNRLLALQREFAQFNKRFEQMQKYINKGLEERKKLKRQYSVRALDRMDEETIEADLKKKSCSKYCNNLCERRLTFEQIKRQRNQYWEIKQGNVQQQYLVTKIIDNEIRIDNKSYFKIENQEVCKLYFFNIVIGVGLTTFTKAIAMAKMRILDLSKTEYNRKGLLGYEAIGHMKNYLKRWGEPSPVDGKILIPDSRTVRSLWMEYKEMSEEQGIAKEMGIKALGESQYQKLWKKNIKPTVSKSKLGKVVKCNCCVRAKNILATSLDPELKRRMKVELDEHYARQRFVNLVDFFLF